MQLRKIDLPNSRYEQLAQLVAPELRKIYQLSPKAKRPPFENIQTYGALIGAEIVGAVQSCRLYGELHLISLMVHPDYRRQGVARSLIDYVAKQIDATELIVETMAETGNVTKFESIGFVELSRQPSELFNLTNGEPATHVRLRKVLG